MIGEVEKIRLKTYDDEPTDGRRWWTEQTPEARALGVQAVINRLQREDGLRMRSSLLHARLYQNIQLDSLYRYNLGRSPNVRPGADGGSGMSHRVTFNVVRSCVDTACAKISKNRPRISFVTSDGSWEQKRRAKGLTSYVDGLFYQSDLYSKTERAFRDACVWGTGAVLLSIDATEGTIHAERALPFELFVDEGEAIHGSPRSMYRVSPKHRDELAEEYGDDPVKLHAIMSEQGVAEFRASGSQSDMINVYEAWHLPSGPKAKDGRHVISVGNCALHEERWIWDWFPVFLYHWSEPLVGHWGSGIAEELTGIQLEISKTLRTIQRAQHIAGGLRVFVEKNAEINTAHINNEIGEIIKYRGTPPIFDSVSRTVPPELYSHLERLVDKAYEMVGVSQLAANARKPSGLDAGVALREFYDIESERFVKQGQRWERYHLEIARAMVQMTAKLYESRPSLKVNAPGTKFLDTIEWSQVRLREDQYEMRPFPTSSLPTTPAYRFQMISELKKAGVIDQDQMMQLLEMPDLDRFMSLQTSSINDIERCLDAITERGEYIPPEPFMDLRRSVKMAVSTLLRAREDGVPERRQELILRWMDEAKSLLEGPAPTVGGGQPAPAPALSGAPPADPAAAGQAVAPVAAPPVLAPEIPPTSNIPALPTATPAVPPSVSAQVPV